MRTSELVLRRGGYMVALGLVLCASGLTGCSDTPHDRVDATQPAKMTTLPMPANTTPAPEKPAATPVPPPSESEVGLPIYPGAKTYVDATGAVVKPDVSENMATAMLETPDSLDAVLNFYKDRIHHADARGNTTPATPREDKVGDRRKVVLTGNDATGNIQMVQLREDGGKTVIELMRTSVKALPSGVPGANTEQKPAESGTSPLSATSIKNP